MTSCEPDGDIENRYYGIGSDQHKSKKKKKSTSTTPKADLVDDFDNHLENSPFAPSDVCPSCGYPRGSSVVCPVSLRHHGTDEVVKSHSRTPSGGMRLFHRLKHKSSKSTTPQEGVTPRSNDPTTPSAMLPPPCTGEGAVVLSANSTPACYEDEPEEGEEEEDGEGPPEEERAMQYYCYTDENGDTYYYAAEMEDTVPRSSTQIHTEEDPPAEEAGTYEGEATTYVYCYTDENGVQQTAVVQGGYGGEAASHATTDALDGSHQHTPRAEKKKNKFASTFNSLFKKKDSRKGSKVTLDSNTVSDGRSNADGSSFPAVEAHVDTTNNSFLYSYLDQQVADYIESLPPAERKKFEKERKSMIQKLEEEEKKQRGKIKSLRKEYMENTARDRRAKAYALKNEEKATKKADDDADPF